MGASYTSIFTYFAILTRDYCSLSYKLHMISRLMKYCNLPTFDYKEKMTFIQVQGHHY